MVVDSLSVLEMDAFAAVGVAPKKKKLDIAAVVRDPMIGRVF